MNSIGMVPGDEVSKPVFPDRPALSALLFLSVMVFALSSERSVAQVGDTGPWWPSAEWGADDQAGASNRVTPDRILSALDLVSTGRVYELGQVYEQGMPLFPGRSYSLLVTPLGAPMGTNQLVGNDDFVSTQIGQVGTQFDGLGHIGQVMRRADGSFERVFYNGHTETEIFAPTGLTRLGVEHVRPLIARGVLIDIAGHKEVGNLQAGYEVTMADVTGALRNQGMAADSVGEGDAVFFRYGWSTFWGDPERYSGSVPGIGLEVARWVVEKKVTAIGSDSYGTEVIPNPDENLVYPVHQELMMKNGVFNIENMQFDELAREEVYEFLFIALPLRLKGATGSPLRPIAIR